MPERKKARHPGRDGQAPEISAPTLSIGTTDRETFRMVPDRLWLDRRLRGSDLKVWCALLFLARGRDYTDATDDAIASQLGISPRTVRDSLYRLERASFIERQRNGENRHTYLRPEGDGEPVPRMALRVVP